MISMKVKTQFVCQQCGASYTKWMGQCASCSSWNSLVEQIVDSGSGAKSAVAKGQASGKKLDFVKMSEVKPSDVKARLSTGFSELNTVLGGGILLGSVSLLAGQPGIGKSTLLMQISAEVAKRNADLYVSGEESAGQVKSRAERLGASSDKLSFASSTSANDIAKKIYHADGVDFTPGAKKQMKELTELGFGATPICVAKTQYSFSDNPKLLGAPSGFRITIRNLKISAGAGFIVALTGDIMTMPGLPKVPAAEKIDVDSTGRISGLF